MMTNIDATRDLWSFYSPILLVLGLFGNCLSLLVTSRDSMRGIASRRYLMAIALADNGSLVFGLLPKWIQHRFDVDVTTFNDFLCKTRNFLFYTSQDSSIWFVCAFTFDRFMVVVFPLRRAVIRATGRIRLSIGTVVLLAVLKNLTIFWSRAVVVVADLHAGSGGENETGSSYQIFCGNPSASSEYFDDYVRPWIVFVTVHCLPFLLLIACNIAIVREIVKVRYIAQQRDSRRSGTSRGRVARMTGLCLAVSLTFLVLEFPSTVLLIGRPYWTDPPATEIHIEGKHMVPDAGITPEGRYSLNEKNSTADVKYVILKVTPAREGRYDLVQTTISPDNRNRLLETNSTSHRNDSIPGDTPTSDQRYKFLEAIASLLNYANCAVNFYLYCLAGSRFRKEFVSLVTRDKFRKHLTMDFYHNRPVNHPALRPQSVPGRRLTDAHLMDTRFVHKAYEDSTLRDLETQISRPRSSTM